MSSSSYLLPSFSLLLLIASSVSSMEFRVGGPFGWKPPTGKESETFNHWAGRNRFHVGDYLYFKYEKNDSVLVVTRKDYAQCNTTGPLLRFTDGNTKFQLDRHGYFYFISGNPGHCKTGQKLIVRVMVHQDFASPSPAPVPGRNDGGSGSADGFSPSGQPGSSGSSRVTVAVHLGVLAVVWSGLNVLMIG